jgi:hypothetical protein
MTLPGRSSWTTVLCALLAAHVVVGAWRLPGKVWCRRVDEVAAYRSKGPAGFFMDTDHHQGAEAVRWLLANAPPHAVVLWRGEAKGALEFVPSLIAPRLLVREDYCAPGADRYLDRPLARLPATNGEPGPVLVVVGEGGSIRMVPR